MGVLEDLGAQLQKNAPPASVIPAPAAPVTQEAQAAPEIQVTPETAPAEQPDESWLQWKGFTDNRIWNNSIGAIIGGVRSESSTAKILGLGYQTGPQKQMEDELASVTLLHKTGEDQRKAYDNIISKYKAQGVYDEEYERNLKAQTIQMAPKEGTFESKMLQDRKEFDKQLDETYGSILRSQETLDPVQASTAAQFKETALAKFDQIYGRMNGVEGDMAKKNAEDYRKFLFSEYLPALVDDSAAMLKETLTNGGDSRKAYADIRDKRADAWSSLNLTRNAKSQMMASNSAVFGELLSGDPLKTLKGIGDTLGGAMNQAVASIEYPYQLLGLYDAFEDFRNEGAIDPASSFGNKAFQSVRKDTEEIIDAVPQIMSMAGGTASINSAMRLGKLSEAVNGLRSVEGAEKLGKMAELFKLVSESEKLAGASRLAYLATRAARAGLATAIDNIAPTIAGQAFIGRAYTPQELADNAWGTVGEIALASAMYRPVKSSDLTKWISQNAIPNTKEILALGDKEPTLLLGNGGDGDGGAGGGMVSARVAQLAENNDITGAAAVQHAVDLKKIDESDMVSVSHLSEKARANLAVAESLRRNAAQKAADAGIVGQAAPDFETLAFADRVKKTVENPGGSAAENAALDSQRFMAEEAVRKHFYDPRYADPNTVSQDMAAFALLKEKWDSLSNEARANIDSAVTRNIESALSRKPGTGAVVENPHAARALETLRLAESLPGGIEMGTAIGQYFKGYDGLWHSYFQTSDVNGTIVGGASDISKLYGDIAKAAGKKSSNGALAEKLRPLFGRLSRNDLRLTDNEYKLLSQSYGKDMQKLWKKEGMGYVPTETLTKILTPTQAKALISDLADESKGRQAIRDADAAASFVNDFGEKTTTATLDDLFSKEARSDKPMHRVQDSLQVLLNDKKNLVLQAAAQGAIDAVSETWRAGDRVAFIRARAAAIAQNIKTSASDLGDVSPEVAKRVVASQVRAAAYDNNSFLDPMARDSRKSAGIFESAEAAMRQTKVTPESFFDDADVAKAVKRFFAKHIDNVEFILGGVSEKGDDILGSFHSAKDKALKSSITTFKQAIADGRTAKEASELMAKTGLHEVMHHLHQYATPDELKAMKLEYGRRLDVEANHVADQMIVEGDLIGTPISREAAVSKARQELISGERGHKWTSWEENAADYMADRFFGMAKDGSFKEYAPGVAGIWAKIVRFFKELLSFSEDLGKHYDRFLRNVMSDTVNGRARKWNDALNGEKFSKSLGKMTPEEFEIAYEEYRDSMNPLYDSLPDNDSLLSPEEIKWITQAKIDNENATALEIKREEALSKEGGSFMDLPVISEIDKKLFTGTFGEKDYNKAIRANKFIGRGSSVSSTEKYRSIFEKLNSANTKDYYPTDTVFISAEGNRQGRIDIDADEINRAASARVVFITDDAKNRVRDYNIGERAVEKLLKSIGYFPLKDGVWVPSAKLVQKLKADKEILSAQRQIIDSGILLASDTAEALQVSLFKRLEDLEKPETLITTDALSLYETLSYMARPSESARIFDELASAKPDGERIKQVISDAVTRNHPIAVTREAIRERKTIEMRRLVAQKSKELEDKGWAFVGNYRAIIKIPSRFVAPTSDSFGRGAVGAGMDSLSPRMFDASLVAKNSVHIVTANISGKVSTDIIKTGDSFTYGKEPIPGRVNVISPTALAASGMRDVGYDGYATIGAENAQLWATALENGLLLPFDVESTKGGLQAASSAVADLHPFIETIAGYKVGSRVKYEIAPGRRASLSDVEAGVVGALETQKTAAEMLMSNADTLGNPDKPSVAYEPYVRGKQVDTLSMFNALPEILGAAEPVNPAVALASLSSFGRMGELMRSAFRSAAKAGGWVANTTKVLQNASELFVRRNGHARLMREALASADDGAKASGRKILGVAKQEKWTLTKAADLYADSLMASYALQGKFNALDFRRKMGGLLAAAAEDKAYGLIQLAPLYRSEWYRAAFGTPWIRAQREAGAQALVAAGMSSKAADVDSRMARAISSDPWNQDADILPLAAFGVLKRMGLFPQDLDWASAKSRVSVETMGRVKTALYGNTDYLFLDPGSKKVSGYLGSLERFVKEINRTQEIDPALSSIVEGSTELLAVDMMKGKSTEIASDVSRAFDVGSMNKHLADDLAGFPDQFAALREGWGELVARRYSLANVVDELVSGSRWMEREPAFVVPHNANLRGAEYASRFSKAPAGAKGFEVLAKVMPGHTFPKQDTFTHLFSAAASFVHKGMQNSNGAYDLLRESSFADFGIDGVLSLAKAGNINFSKILDRDLTPSKATFHTSGKNGMASALADAVGQAAKTDEVSSVIRSDVGGDIYFARKYKKVSDKLSAQPIDSHPLFRAFYNEGAKIDPEGAKRAETGGIVAKVEFLASKMSATAAKNMDDLLRESAKKILNRAKEELVYDNAGKPIGKKYTDAELKKIALRLNWGSPEAKLAEALWDLSKKLRSDTGMIRYVTGDDTPVATKVSGLIGKGEASGVVAYWSPLMIKEEIDGPTGLEVLYRESDKGEGKWMMYDDTLGSGLHDENAGADYNEVYLDYNGIRRWIGEPEELFFTAHKLIDDKATEPRYKIETSVSGYVGGFDKTYILTREELGDPSRNLEDLVGGLIAEVDVENIDVDSASDLVSNVKETRENILALQKEASQDRELRMERAADFSFMLERADDESHAAHLNDCI
jgi:hypothetical protein